MRVALGYGHFVTAVRISPKCKSLVVELLVTPWIIASRSNDGRVDVEQFPRNRCCCVVVVVMHDQCTNKKLVLFPKMRIPFILKKRGGFVHAQSGYSAHF